MDTTEEVKTEPNDDNSDEIDDFHEELREEAIAEAKRNFNMLLESRPTVDRNTAYKMFQDFKVRKAFNKTKSSIFQDRFSREETILLS